MHRARPLTLATICLFGVKCLTGRPALNSEVSGHIPMWLKPPPAFEDAKMQIEQNAKLSVAPMMDGGDFVVIS